MSADNKGKQGTLGNLGFLAACLVTASAGLTDAMACNVDTDQYCHPEQACYAFSNGSYYACANEANATCDSSTCPTSGGDGGGLGDGGFGGDGDGSYGDGTCSGDGNTIDPCGPDDAISRATHPTATSVVTQTKKR